MHSAIERLLGDLGPAVHAGRSRNDQVQTAMRLWVMQASDDAAAAVRELGSGAGRARPRQTATPCCPATRTVSVPSRCGWDSTWPRTDGRSPATCDGSRRCASAADCCPLGAGALAGSSLPLDPDWVAQELGFSSRFENPLDAVSDRDYVSGLVYAATLCMVHLSRLAEELVLWTSAEYGFAELDDSAATGSSMMPQKKNPDAAELTRGKAGTAVGRLAGLLATLKGLPLAYNRDLQEDKRAAFDAGRRPAGRARGDHRVHARPAVQHRADGGRGQRRADRRHRRGRATRARRRAVSRSPPPGRRRGWRPASGSARRPPRRPPPRARSPQALGEQLDRLAAALEC